MTKLQRVQLSLVISGLTGAYVAIHAGMRVSENILAISTTSCGIGMLVGQGARSLELWTRDVAPEFDRAAIAEIMVRSLT